MSTHRKVTRIAGLLVVASFVFAACSSSTSSSAPTAGASTGGGAASAPASAGASAEASGGAANMDALIAAAKAEGGLNDDRPAARLVQLRRAHRRLHRQVRDPDQRAQPGRRLRRRARSHQGQQGPTRARRRLTSSTSACRSARRPSPTASIQPYKVATWDTIPDDGQGRRRHLVRRLLRRPGVRGQHHGRQERPEGLGRPAQARVQEPGRPRR